MEEFYRIRRLPPYVFEQEQVPGLSVSASRDRQGRLHVSLSNLNPNAPAQVVCEWQGAKAKRVTGRVLTAPTMQAHNTFEQPAVVRPAAFDAVQLTDTGLTATLPAKSVVVLEVE